MDKALPSRVKSVSQDAVWSVKLIGPGTWPDFERMFDKHKGCGGCWCAYHLCPSTVFQGTDRDGHKALHRSLVMEGRACGVVCYLDGIPVGWGQFGPAPLFEQISRSKNYLKCLERDATVPRWRVTCVFVDKDYRRLGLSKRVLSAGVEAIRSLGGGLTEAYPLEAPGSKRPPYTGSVRMYEAEGFKCVAPMGKNHFIMRAEL